MIKDSKPQILDTIDPVAVRGLLNKQVHIHIACKDCRRTTEIRMSNRVIAEFQCPSCGCKDFKVEVMG